MDVRYNSSYWPILVKTMNSVTTCKSVEEDEFFAKNFQFPLCLCKFSILITLHKKYIFLSYRMEIYNLFNLIFLSLKLCGGICHDFFICDRKWLKLIRNVYVIILNINYNYNNCEIMKISWPYLD